MQPSVIVFTGGEPVDPAVAARLPADAFVIAADSGVDHAVAAGRHVDLAIGDFDSVSPAALQLVADAGARVERHPAAKDQTDIELALRAAAAEGAARIVMVGGAGGRLDHLLANLLVLSSSRLAGISIEALIGDARIYVVHDRVELDGSPGELVSLLPVGGRATGVRTTGLLYPLDGEDLVAGSSRGVSNELVAPLATVGLTGGTLLVIKPGRS